MRFDSSMKHTNRNQFERTKARGNALISGKDPRERVCRMEVKLGTDLR